jgi:hypothetical protein
MEPLSHRAAAGLITAQRLIATSALMIALCGLCSTRPQADEPEVLEQQVKAAFLYKFGNYVTWPEGTFAESDSPIVIGVAGAEPLAYELTRIVAGRSIAKHPVSVRRIRRDDPLDGVHILFVGSTGWAGSLLKLAQGHPVLCVTDSDHESNPDSAVTFVVEDNRVRFDVSLQAAQANGLKLSALLLSVARQVRGKLQ